MTYYFNDQDKITGMFYRALSPKEVRPPDRRCEFEKWAEAKYPGEIAKLEPGGRIDPALENARRWKAMLVEWRQEAGLPPVG